MSRFQELERSGSEAELEREETLSIPEIKQRRAVLPSDVRKVIVGEEGQQEWSPSLDQEDPPEPPHIKEEQEELWTSQEGEQLQGLEEADITKFLFTPVPVKSEDDEEKPQSSQLHQRQTEQMKTGADGEDCGGPEPARNSHPDPHLQPETEVSDDWSRKTRENQSGLKSQKNKVSKSDGKPFSCSDCGKRFSLNRNIDRHMRIHTGEKPFTCSFCGQRFTQKPHMTRHMAIHTGEKPFSCSDCGKTFIRKEDMTRHMVVHTGEKRFSCSICDQRFAWPDQLRKHKCVCPQSSQLHQTEQNREAEPGATREKPFSCPDCGKRFQNKRNLTQHMLIHTGERRFSCSICGKRFTQQGHLSKHMAFHTGEKPFSCSFCGKRFTQKVHMTGHMAIHTGEKRFSCSVCDQRFTWDIQLRKHKRVCPQSSQLHQTEQNMEAEPGASSSTEQMETGADGEDCGGPEPARNSHPDF